MGYIDIDSHVLECDDTWEYFDPAEREHRPFQLRMDTQKVGGAGTSFGALWRLGDAWSGVFPPDAMLHDGAGNRYDPDTVTMRDPSRRIAELDTLGIDVQMLYTTTFLTAGMRHPVAEAAIKRSWNRWMAERVADSGGRFSWAAEIPVRMLDRAVQEAEFAAEHGAKAVHLHAVESGCYLDDPYFDHLFTRLQALDLTIVVHIAAPLASSRAVFSIGTAFRSMAPYMDHLASPLSAFWTVLATDLHKRYPKLRFFFSEVGAMWTFSLLHHWERIKASQSADFRVRRIDPAVLEEKNIFIGCFVDEDLALLTSRLGENVLAFGTDYGHNDLSSQLGGHTAIVERDDISAGIARKIVDDNGRRAFGLDSAFRPADSIEASAELPHTRAVQSAAAGALGVVSIGV
ncbi:amidohydrolase family protein [Amycolatopsis pithecellobii]|nr:amidohydrolase family protein [Amycolatopsis pithecellobii]